MEPAAPGTEDDAIQPTLSKKASDDERLLSIKADLPSGRYGNVFSKSYNDGMEQWYCNICECPVMGRMFHHETGKRHTQQITKMEQRQQRSKDRYGKDEKMEEEKPEVKEEESLYRTMGSGLDHAKINVAPGEPVPPGVDGEASRVAQIQERLDKFKASALLGLEYLLEITDYDINKEPSYLCALCDKKGDPRTVIAHLVSYNHLQQFMQRHFPATYRALSPYITRQYRKNWQDTMNSIAEAIETKYGRLLPHPVEKDTFEKRKDFYYQVIHMGPHFSEKNGITFEHMVKPEEITKHIEDDPGAIATDGTTGKTAAAVKKRSPSPPVVAKPKRVRSNPDNIRNRRNSLSSVSSISSNDLNESSGTIGGDGMTKEGTTGFRRSPVRGARGGRVRGVRGVGGMRKRLSRSGSRSLSLSPERGRNSRSRSKSRTRYQNSHNPRYSYPHRGMSYRGGIQNNRGVYVPNRFAGNVRRSRSPLSRSPRNHERRSRSPRSPRIINDRRPPWERSNYSSRAANRSPPPPAAVRLDRAKVERESKVEEYSRLCKAIENDMGRVLKGHEKNPEKHPQYNDEWKLFWNKRYKELQVEGKDAANYDFKPEWIIVWNKRMMELHNIDVKVKKDALRRRLGLREEPAPISFRIGKQHSPNGKGPAPVAAQPDQDHEVIIIDDKDDETPGTRKPTAVGVLATVSPVRSHSPWETDIPAASVAPAVGKKKADELASRKPPGQARLDNKAEGKSLPRSRDELTRTVIATRPARGRPITSKDRDVRVGGGGPVRDRDRVTSLERDGRDRRYGYDSRERDGRRSRDDTVGGWDRRGAAVGVAKSRSPRSRTPSSPNERERYYRERDRDYLERERSWERVINRHREMRMVPAIPDAYRPPIIMRDVTSTPMHYLPTNMMPMQQRPPSPEIDIPDEPVSIVSVLRLLTALEETLGSLGPKVIDLLTNALALEKNQPNSAEILLDNEINCVMFETVKEKLKGRLQAGLVTYKQEKAVKHAIKSLASLIHDASQRKRIRLQQAALNPLTVPGVGVVDKAAIAKQIATALVLQGKTDVSQGELEQLINAVVGMAEASRHSDTPINTATFLSKCREKTPEFTPKIIIPTVLKEKEKERLKLEQQLALADQANSKSEDDNNAMEGLSDSDLQTLLQNFKDLSTDEQHGLISYLKKLEAREPLRVEKLRQFVNMGKTDDSMKIVHDLDGKVAEDQAKEKIKFDSDEEEYSYEDVFKAAKQNVTKKEREDKEERARKIAELEEEEKRNMEINLDQAKMIIANLMGTISKQATESTPSSHSTNLLGFITNTANALDVNQDPFEHKPESAAQLKPTITIKTEATLKASIVPDAPVIRPTHVIQPGPSSSNSNDSRLFFEPLQQQTQLNRSLNPFDTRTPFTDSDIRIKQLTSNNMNQDSDSRLNPTGFNQMNRDPRNSPLGANVFDFKPQLQSSGGGGGGGGLPPPPPQPPFQGANPYGMVSYPTPNVHRNYLDGMRFGGFNSDPQNRGAFNPFSDGTRSSFNMSNEGSHRGSMQQQQNSKNSQRGYSNSNRW